MKQLLSKPLPVRAIAVLLLLTGVIIIHSCRKDANPSHVSGTATIATAKGIDISKLQNAYQTGIKTPKKLNDVSQQALSAMIGSLDVSWTGYTVIEYPDSSKVVEFSIPDDTTMFVNQGQHLSDSCNYHNKTNAVFILQKDTVKTSFFMKTIEQPADSSYQSVIDQLHYLNTPSTFNGQVLYFTLGRQFINGYQWQNGNPTGTVSLSGLIPSQQDQQTRPKNNNALTVYCRNTVIYEVTTVTVNNPLLSKNSSYQGATTSNVYTPVGSATTCDFVDSDSFGSGGSSGAGFTGGVTGGGVSGPGTITQSPSCPGPAAYAKGQKLMTTSGCPVVAPTMTTARKQAAENTDNNRILKLLQQEDALDDAAPNPCHGTRRSGNVAWKGVLEHWLIQTDYLDRNPGAMKEYYIPGSSSKVPGNAGFADIVNTTTNEMFEIKPDNPEGHSTGAAEIQIYVTQANINCPPNNGGPWFAGRSYTPRYLLDPRDPTKLILCGLSSAGVIQYKSVARKGAPVPVPLPIQLPRSLADKLKTLLKQLAQSPSTMEPQILAFLRQNPQIVPYLKGAAVAVVIGTILEDIATEGIGIADDWESFLIARTLWRVSNEIVLY